MQAPDVHFTHEACGKRVTIRTMRHEDKHIEADFVRGLSQQSRYYRFHSSLRELSEQMLEEFTNVDYPREMALIATVESDPGEQQIAVARYVVTSSSGDTAELAVVVGDAWQGCGLGTRLLMELRDMARTVGVTELRMRVLSENRGMLKLANKLGFVLEKSQDGYSSRKLGKSIDSGVQTHD